MTDKPIAGVDIAKEWLDICVDGDARVERIANSAEAAGAWLDRVGPGLVAFEPTGGHERVLVAALRERGMPFVRVHPNDLIAFRQSRGVKAKSRPDRCPADPGFCVGRAEPALRAPQRDRRRREYRAVRIE
jgi:transposase